jgi:hypothetical protein
MRRYDHHINNSLLIALDELILLKEDVLVLILFEPILQPEDILTLLFVRVRVKESELDTFNFFGKEKIKLQYKLLLFV